MTPFLLPVKIFLDYVYWLNKLFYFDNHRLGDENVIITATPSIQSSIAIETMLTTMRILEMKSLSASSSL